MTKKVPRSEPKRDAWASRIVGEATVPAQSLKANPKNWRLHPQGQVDAIEDLLAGVGWIQRVIVNKRTGYVIDGHARVSLAATKGESVPVLYVDLSPEEEALVMASVDPLSSMAVTDDELLVALLTGAQAAGESLDQLLNSTVSDARRTATVEVGQDSRERFLGDRKTLIKPALYVGEVAVFERAIRATGQRTGMPGPSGHPAHSSGPSPHSSSSHPRGATSQCG